MAIQLLPHQQEAVDKLSDTQALLLYHGLGSGKTITSIAATLGDKTDVIVPASLRENFKKELNKFDGSKKYNVRSYHHFLSHGPDSKYKTIIVDEPQKIGRTSSSISQAMVNAAPEYSKRILLTGTPASNNPAELAPIIRFLNPEADIPLNPTEFNKQFIDEKKVPVGFFNWLAGARSGVSQDIKNKEALMEAIKGRVHYHEPSREFFPERVDHTVNATASEEQVHYYKAVTEQANPIIAMKVRNNLPFSKKELSNLNAFMAAARQVSNTTAPYGGQEELSNKMKALIDNIRKNVAEDPKHKSIVYSNYIDAGITPLAKHLDGIKYKTFTGGMTDKEKQEAVDLYNKGKINALLLSGSGAEGIDLKNTGSIHILEPHWNKNKIEQVIGRGVRYKSHKGDKTVHVYKYQTVMPQNFIQKLLGRPADTSADQVLENLSEKKQELLNKFLDVMKQEGQMEKAAATLKELYKGVKSFKHKIIRGGGDRLSRAIEGLPATRSGVGFSAFNPGVSKRISTVLDPYRDAIPVIGLVGKKADNINRISKEHFGKSGIIFTGKGGGTKQISKVFPALSGNVKALDRANKKAVNLTFLHHENLETGVKAGVANPAGQHLGQKVMWGEHNITTTMGPRLAKAKKLLINVRSMSGDANRMARDVPHMKDFSYGSSNRVSRHFIKNMEKLQAKKGEEFFKLTDIQLQETARAIDVGRQREAANLVKKNRFTSVGNFIKSFNKKYTTYQPVK
jgi:superfamily II DNA or RNA helicase